MQFQRSARRHRPALLLGGFCHAERKRMKRASIWCMLLVGSFFGFGPANASSPQTVEEFYRGNTITLQIGTSAGGGYDTYARLFARYFGRHVPGNPVVLPQNVPGAGSLKLANDLYNVAPRDGTVIGAIGKEQVTAPLFGVAGVRFDARKINWLGTLDRATSVCVSWHTSSFRSFAQARETEMVFGGTGPASVTVVLPTALREILGYKLKVVSGYPGGNEVSLALERGEIDGRCGWSYASLMSTHADWQRDGKLHFLVAASRSRIPALPDVPSVLELASNERQRQILSVILAGEAMARPFLTPPGVPPERLAALRQAFRATAMDPEFVEKAKLIGLDIDAGDWQEMNENIQKLYATPTEIVSIAAKLIKQGRL
jgi:tripartite-type tricarboxylate transporter receptor subunit TctC